jgi:hypothetical protein
VKFESKKVGKFEVGKFESKKSWKFWSCEIWIQKSWKIWSWEIWIQKKLEDLWNYEKMGLRGRMNLGRMILGHWMKLGEIDGERWEPKEWWVKIDLKKVEVGNVWVLDDMWVWETWAS